MKFKGYCKKYADKVIFQDFDLTLDNGEITVLLGNSGVGKTTLLNALAGLDKDFSGQVDTLPCSYIFQEPRLLKGATVYQNVFLACHDKERTNDLLTAVELSDYSSAYPKELSGGMAQRVSMARAFSAKRELLLMDEPFSSLDVGLKHRLYKFFRTLWEKDRPTTVFITHDLNEAFEIGDRIIIIKGSPAKIVFDERITEPTQDLKDRIKAVLIEND